MQAEGAAFHIVGCSCLSASACLLMGCSYSLQHYKFTARSSLLCSQAVLDIVAKLAGFASHADIKGSEVTALTYAADLCYQLTLTRTFRAAEWVSAVSPFLAPYIGETEAHAVAEGSRTRCGHIRALWLWSVVCV